MFLYMSHILNGCADTESPSSCTVYYIVQYLGNTNLSPQLPYINQFQVSKGTYNCVLKHSVYIYICLCIPSTYIYIHTYTIYNIVQHTGVYIHILYICIYIYTECLSTHASINEACPNSLPTWYFFGNPIRSPYPKTIAIPKQRELLWDVQAWCPPHS